MEPCSLVCPWSLQLLLLQLKWLSDIIRHDFHSKTKDKNIISNREYSVNHRSVFTRMVQLVQRRHIQLPKNSLKPKQRFKIFRTWLLRTVVLKYSDLVESGWIGRKGDECIFVTTSIVPKDFTLIPERILRLLLVVSRIIVEKEMIGSKPCPMEPCIWLRTNQTTLCYFRGGANKLLYSRSR